jgi:hypothetical protein
MDAAAVLSVAGRTVRRWMEGIAAPPAEAISRLEALARELDQAAEAAVRAMHEVGSAPAALAVYRRDEDVPPWTGLPTAGCHLAFVRRVVDRRPDVRLVTYNRSAYRRWLGSRSDSEELRTAWASRKIPDRALGY